jgi:hypothetical protein
MHRKVDEIHRAVRALWKDLARLQSEKERKERAPARRTRGSKSR